MQELVTLIREYARERYYRASWDVVAERWSDGEIAAAIAGARTRRGAIAKAWGKLQQIDAIRDSFDGRIQFGARPERPTSLFEFLGLCGGLRPDPELRVILDGNVFLGGRAGWLIRDGGLSLDSARRLAVEANYLADTSWEGGVSVSTINDLLDLIDREARGDRQYPYGQAETEFDYTDDEENDDDIPF